MPTPIFLNTGGGAFGAIRSRILGDSNLVEIFGTKVIPGRFRQAQALEMPYISMTHASAQLDSVFTDVPKADSPSVGPYQQGDRYDTWKESIQIAIYGDAYENTRQLGRLIHCRISRQTMMCDCNVFTLFPDSRMLQQEASTIDYWHYDFRYHFWTADRLLQDNASQGD